MPNTSATGGYLQQTNAAPLSDAALQDFIQEWIVGISGLAANLVMPRWQPTPPNIPNEGIDWIAFGLQRKKRYGTPFIKHIPTADSGKGIDQLRQHEELFWLASIYGSNADLIETRLSQGMLIAQNREILQLSNIEFVECEDPVSVPEKIKDLWLYRVDLSFTLRRQIILEYAVQNLLSAHGDIIVDVETEQYSDTFETTLP